MTEPTLQDRAKAAIASLKEAEDLARHKTSTGKDLEDTDLEIIGNACEDAIIAIRFLLGGPSHAAQIQAAVEQEREECAKIADRCKENYHEHAAKAVTSMNRALNSLGATTCSEIAHAIRERT